MSSDKRLDESCSQYPLIVELFILQNVHFLLKILLYSVQRKIHRLFSNSPLLYIKRIVFSTLK